MPKRANKLTGRADFQEKRENAMRPSRYLGYDHDGLGVYFLAREANALAEAEFRRAVWLNPFEPAFQLHLGMCLFQQEHYGEAAQIAHDVLQKMPNSLTGQELLRLATERLAGPADVGIHFPGGFGPR